MLPMAEQSRFLDKWKLVRAAAKDKQLSLGDISVLIALCDRYGSKYDKDAPALAGHALLGAMAGLSRRATIDSTHRLIDAGYITVIELGSGTRGTRYGLTFSRGEDSFTTKDESSSGEAQITTVVKQTAPLGNIRGEARFTESPPTVSPLQGGIHVVGDRFEDAASPAPGLSAVAAVPASGEVEQFWRIWPRKHGITKTEAEWAKLTPDQHAAAILAASLWADHYRRHGTEKKWIPEPANWLRMKRWLEDLPEIHIDAKGAAIAKAKANALPKFADTPANDNQPGAGIPATEKPDFTMYPDQPALGTIERVEDYTHEEDGAKSLTIYYRTQDGKEIEHFFIYESPDRSDQENGQEELRKLLDAVDLGEVNNADELVGCKVDLMINGTKFVSCSKPWVPAPKNPRMLKGWKEVVETTPLGGWCKMIGTADEDEEEKVASRR